MKKLVSLVVGISLLAASLITGKVSAASANMSQAGASQSNGNFSTVVYETSDGPVSSVSINMSFSQAVSNVSYDYSVGPFTTADPSGGHLSQGSVTGTQAVARVSFTLAGPGTVSAAVNAGASYLKGASGTTVVYYTISPAPSDFVYNAPAGGQGGGNNNNDASNDNGTADNGGSNNGSNNNAAASNGEVVATTETPAANGDVKSDTTKSDSKNNKDGDKTNTAAKKNQRTVWPWVILIVLGAAAVMYGLRSRNKETEAPADAKKAGAKSADKPADKVKKVAEKAAVAAPVAAAAKKAAPKTDAKKPAQNQNRNRNNKGGKKSGKKSR